MIRSKLNSSIWDKSLLSFRLLRSFSSKNTNPPPFASNDGKSTQSPPSGDTDAESNTKSASKATNIFKSILRGSNPTGMPTENQTYSKTLANGKKIYEFQFHYVKPDRVQDYVKLISGHYPTYSQLSGVKHKGSWETIIGELDTFVHVWEYEDGYKTLDEVGNVLIKDKMQQEYLNKLGSLLRRRENEICLEFAFWTPSISLDKEAIFELRSYVLKPGCLLEWESNWKKGLIARKQYCNTAGAWFSQVGSLNHVHHLWMYPDMATRKEMREAAWRVEGWPQTVYNTVRLIERMKSTIMKPIEF